MVETVGEEKQRKKKASSLSNSNKRKRGDDTLIQPGSPAVATEEGVKEKKEKKPKGNKRSKNVMADAQGKEKAKIKRKRKNKKENKKKSNQKENNDDQLVKADAQGTGKCFCINSTREEIRACILEAQLKKI